MIFLFAKTFVIGMRSNGQLEDFIFPIMRHLQAFGAEWYIGLGTELNKPV
jgi:hypothetical protein